MDIKALNVNVLIEKAIADFDFEGEVTRLATNAITEAIRYTFVEGDGAAWIQKTLKEAFTVLFTDKL